MKRMQKIHSAAGVMPAMIGAVVVAFLMSFENFNTTLMLVGSDAPLTIGAGCTLGHAAIVHGCTIGDNSLIGIQSVVLNRAVIGRNSLVGAGSLVPEGKVFPDGVLLMGRPAKVVRELSPAEQQIITLSARHYVQNAARFATGLKPLD